LPNQVEIRIDRTLRRRRALYLGDYGYIGPPKRCCEARLNGCGISVTLQFSKR